MSISQWKFRKGTGGNEDQGQLTARWEVNFDPISDDYTPSDISASELFDIWVKVVGGKYPHDLIPIYWSVLCPERKLFETMPFQYSDFDKGVISETFLTHFTWPIDLQTGDELNWLTLPVDDKLWNDARGDKGGFIQEATGWKPSILQPYVYLTALTSMTGIG
jgi:hypothetical protein